MTKVQFVVLSLLTVLALTGACAPERAPTTIPAAPTIITPGAVPAAPIPKAPGKEPWEEEWEGVVAAARREGKVTAWICVGAEARAAITTAFKSKFGITVESVAGTGAESAAKILAERRAGLYFWDLYVSGVTTMINSLKPAGALDPMEPALILPEVKDPKFWWQGNRRWIDRSRTIHAATTYPIDPMLLNTGLVSPQELRSYRDLLDPKWKGKMTMDDPTTFGKGQASIAALAWEIMGVDYARQLAKQEPMLMRDRRLQVEWCAKGKYPIAIAAYPEIALEFITAGVPLKVHTPIEGTYVSTGSGNLCLFNRAPHPNAAKVFVNWLLTQEGSTLFARKMFTQSARIDVPTDFLDPSMVRDPNMKYFFGADEEFRLKLDAEWPKLSKEIFGHLIK